MEEKIGTRVNHNRTDEILASGADTVATACPFCTIMLRDGVQDRNAGDKVAGAQRLRAGRQVDEAQARARGRRRGGERPLEREVAHVAPIRATSRSATARRNATLRQIAYAARTVADAVAARRSSRVASSLARRSARAAVIARCVQR